MRRSAEAGEQERELRHLRFAIDDLQFCFDGNWGFGQNRQERKWAFELNIVVDVIGQYVQNGRGEEERRDKGRKGY